MNYDVVVTSCSGARICAATLTKLDDALDLRRILIDRFAREPEWQGDYARELTVTAVDTDKGAAVELTDLAHSFV